MWGADILFPQISLDRNIEETVKPDLYDGINPELYAKESVKKAVSALVKSKVAYDTTIAKSFAHYKGSSIEFFKYLKGIQPIDIEKISERIGREQGDWGRVYPT